MNQPNSTPEPSAPERLSQLDEIYSGISAEICRSDIDPQHKVLFGIFYPAMFAFPALAAFKAPWFAYLFLTGVACVFALIITRNGTPKKSREVAPEFGAELASGESNRAGAGSDASVFYHGNHPPGVGSV